MGCVCLCGVYIFKIGDNFSERTLKGDNAIKIRLRESASS